MQPVVRQQVAEGAVALVAVDRGLTFPSEVPKSTSLFGLEAAAVEAAFRLAPEPEQGLPESPISQSRSNPSAASPTPSASSLLSASS